MHTSLRLRRGARSPRSVLMTAVVTCGSLWLMATSASAELSRITVGDGAATCTPLPYCDTSVGGACVGIGGDCRSLPGHDRGICTTLPSAELEAFCCESNTDCPAIRGMPGQCARITGVPMIGPTGGAAPRVCVDPNNNWCVGTPVTRIDVTSLRSCLTPPVGMTVVGRVATWKEGDCDGDGVANGPDGCPCQPGPADGASPGCPSLLPPDAGVSDSGVIAVDASVSDGGVIIDPADAGAPVDDAGAPPDDAGAPPDDAGAPPDDASVPADDASTPPPAEDSGAAPAEDAGPPPSSFTGAGGCSLSAGRSGASGGPLLLALLGLAILRRRRG